jgi:hypothetical protein
MESAQSSKEIPQPLHLELFDASETGPLDITWLGIGNGRNFRPGGGGIRNRGVLSIHRSSLYLNNGGKGDGGAIHSSESLIMSETEIKNNFGTTGGGILTTGTALIEDSFILQNGREISGSGIWIRDGR